MTVATTALLLQRVEVFLYIGVGRVVGEGGEVGGFVGSRTTSILRVGPLKQGLERVGYMCLFQQKGHPRVVVVGGLVGVGAGGRAWKGTSVQSAVKSYPVFHHTKKRL